MADTAAKRRQAATVSPFFSRRRRGLTAAAILFAITAAALFVAFVLLPSLKYHKAKNLLAQDEPALAMEELSRIYNFRDSAALYGKAAASVGDFFLGHGCDIDAAVWYTRAGRSLDAERIFDFHSVVTGASYVTAGIGKNGRCYYLSNREGDDRRAGLQAVSSYRSFLPQAPGVNGLDRFGLVRLHSLGGYGVNLTDEQLAALSTTAGVKDLLSIPGGNGTPGYTVLLYVNGAVEILSAGDKPLTNIVDWKDIVSVKEGYRKIFGIDGKGRLHIAYEKDYPAELRYDVTGWNDVRKVAETGKAIVALTENGQIRVAYAGTDVRYQNSLTYQKEITDIASNSNLLLLLRSNGSVKAIRVPNWAGGTDSGADRYLDKAAAAVRSWRGVTRIRFAANGIYGIRFNGDAFYVSCDVTYRSDKRRYEYDEHRDFAAAVGSWADVADVINCGTHAVAVFADGTVKAVGDGTYLEPRTTQGGATDYLRKTDGIYLNVDTWKLW